MALALENSTPPPGHKPLCLKELFIALGDPSIRMKALVKKRISDGTEA